MSSNQTLFSVLKLSIAFIRPCNQNSSAWPTKKLIIVNGYVLIYPRNGQLLSDLVMNGAVGGGTGPCSEELLAFSRLFLFFYNLVLLAAVLHTVIVHTTATRPQYSSLWLVVHAMWTWYSLWWPLSQQQPPHAGRSWSWPCVVKYTQEHANTWANNVSQTSWPDPRTDKNTQPNPCTGVFWV